MNPTSEPLPGLFSVPAPPQWMMFLGNDKYAHQDGPPTIHPMDYETLVRVNDEVNSMGYQRDLYGDVWEPRAPGDCEDLSLLKRQILVEREGWEWGSLRIAVGKLRGTGEGHAVLCACTDEGDYLLDCLAPYIGPWKAFSRSLDLNYRHVEGLTWEMLHTPKPEPIFPTRRSYFPSRDR